MAARKKITRKSREVRMQAILEAARQVFEEQGYDKAKVSDIADRIGVVEGTVFSYFSSKRVLVLKVMEQFYQDITDLIEGGISAVSGSRNRLQYIIWNHLNIVSTNRALCAVILRESRGLDRKLAKQVHELNRRYTHIIANVVDGGIVAGELRSDVSVVLVRNTIFGTIEHYLWDMLSGDSQINIDTVATDITHMVYRGIAARDLSVSSAEVSTLVKKLNRML